MRPTIVHIGSAVVDVIARTRRLPIQVGETLKGNSISFLAGGKAANTSAQCSLLGAHSIFIGRMGFDHFGKDIIGKKLQMLGVDTEHTMFIKDGKGTGVSMVMVDENTGKNSILLIPNENDFIKSSETLNSLAKIKSISAIALQLEIPIEVSLKVAKYVKDKDKSILVGLNPSPIPDKHDDLIDQCMQLSDIICLNEVEAAQITKSPKKVTSIHDAAEACLNLAQILSSGKKIQNCEKSLIVTLGDQGSVSFCGKTQKMHHIYPSNDKSVSSVGAGDSFFATLLYFMSKRYSLEESCRIASLASGMSVTAEGAIDSFKNIAQINERIEKDGLPLIKKL